MEVLHNIMRIIGNEVDHLGTAILERDYTRERLVQKVLLMAGEALIGILFLGGILAFFFAVA